MSSVTLKLLAAPSSDRVHATPELVRPLFRGNGDTDYLCGHCGAVMAASMAPAERVIVDTATCSACGAVNEFPADLRM